MSDTPRTDDQIAATDAMGGSLDDFARQLERELREWNVRAERAEAILAKACRAGSPNVTFCTLNDYLLRVEEEKTALQQQVAELQGALRKTP